VAFEGLQSKINVLETVIIMRLPVIFYFFLRQGYI